MVVAVVVLIKALTDWVNGFVTKYIPTIATVDDSIITKNNIF